MLDFYAGLSEILEVDLSEINPNFTLADSPAGWDSLSVISIIALLDELFECTFSGDALSECVTVSDIEFLIKNAKK
jgi:acyl carrier protein